MKTFFKIALSGLSEADARKVLQTLESPKLGNWTLSEGGNSDLLVIDVDSVWGHMDWLRALADDRRCAAYTEQESIRDCELLLRKPLDPQALTAILLKVQGGPQDQRPEPADAKAAKPAPAPAPRPSPAVAPPSAAARAPRPAPAVQTPPSPAATPATAPEAAKPAAQKSSQAISAPAPAPAAPPAADAPSTVGALLLAGGIDAPVLVKDGDSGTTLFIDPVRNVYRAPPQLKPLAKVLALSTTRLTPVDGQDPQVQHAGPEQPIVRLLWFAALIASDGKLAPHLDPSSTWKLTRWPQIEREFPRHFRIATAMMKQAGTLEDVATAAKSPVEDVAGFINAYYVAGYVAAEGSDEPEEAANSTANVLSRLRRTFSRGTRPATS